MSSDGDDDVPLGARKTVASQPASRSVVAPPQRAAAAGIKYTESSDDEAPLMSRPQPKSKTSKPASGVKAATKVKAQEERQSAAQAGPVSAAKQAAVKQAAAEMLRDDRRDAARQAAKKQAAVKNSEQRLQKPVANGVASKANDKRHGKNVSSKMPVIPTVASGRRAGSKKGKVAPVKKLFSIPNQKKDTPEASDPLRIFYSSTRDQIAALKDDNGNQRRSLMCDSWLLDHGLIPDAEISEVARYVHIEKNANKYQSPTKGKAPDSNGRPNKQIAARKEASKSKVPPHRKPAPAPIPIKKPLLPASKRAAVDKRVKAEATLAAMGGSSDDDDDIPFAKRIKN